MVQYSLARPLLGAQFQPCARVCSDRYGSRDRSPVRYKSRSPLPVRACSPVAAQSGGRQQLRPRSASRSPDAQMARRPRERLLGKTPPLPSRSQSSSPRGHSHDNRAELKGREAPVTKCRRDRSRSPLAYSSRKVARPYTPPSPAPQPKMQSGYEKKYSASPARKRNSPPPKAYALTADRQQSPRWSRSRSQSVNRKYSSRSPLPRMDNRSSSSTSPPRYGRSPSAREANVKREAVIDDDRMKMLAKRDHSPDQHYRYTSKHSRSPEVAKRDRSPIYQHANSAALRRQPPDSPVPRRRASPEPARTKLESYRTAQSSVAAQVGANWSQAVERPDQNRSRSPAVSSLSVARNGRSPSDHGRTVARSDRGSNAAVGGHSPVSRYRHSPRRNR